MEKFESLHKRGDQERPMTNIDRRQCKRVVPMEVLCLGQSRTGTTSLRTALYQLGYDDIYHYHSCIRENPRDAEMWIEAYKAKYEKTGKHFGREEFDQLLGHCMGVTDHPCAGFAPELIMAYPEAKVILSVRDSPEAWLQSVLKSIWPFIQLRYGPAQSWRVKFLLWTGLLPPLPGHLQQMSDMTAKYGPFGNVPRDGIQWYLNENERVRRLVPKEKLLEWNVKEGWAPLCKFLGKPVPDTPFPRLNDSEHMKTRSAALKQMMMRRMQIRLLGAVTVVGAVGFAVTMFVRSGGLRFVGLQ